MLFSLVSLFSFGLKLGIDFTGGSLSEVKFERVERPSREAVEQAIAPLNLGGLNVNTSGASTLIIKFADTSEETHQAILNSLQQEFITPLVDTKPSETEPTPSENNQGDEQAPEAQQNENTSENSEPQGRDAAQQDNNQSAISQESNTPSISEGPVMIELRFEAVGPSIGNELREKSIAAMIIVIIAIIVYIAWAFRKVSQPVASWKYAIAAIIALIHDVLITLGVFSLLGHFYGIEVNVTFVAALLTILGYSVNDTIVVFDRIRENLFTATGEFASTVNTALHQTLWRSLNTSITTLIVLFAIYFYGGDTIKDFVLALIIGLIAGGYSSIFIASPLLVDWYNWQRKNTQK